MERKMKDSCIPWIGEIPEHWKIARIKDIYSFQTGATPPSKTESFYDGDNLWANIGDINGKIIFETSKHLSDEGVSVCSMNISPKGSLLYSFKLSVGQVAFCGVDMYTNEAIATFIGEPTALSYLYYVAPLFIVFNANTNIYGAPILNQDLIKNAIIPVPPLAEQERTAAYLDEKCGDIDELIEVEQQMISDLEAYRQSVITETVTHGLNQNVRMIESGCDWFDSRPSHWHTEKIRNLFVKRSEKNNPIKTRERLSLSIDKGITLYADKTTNLDRFKDDFTQYQLAYPNDIVLNSMNMIVGAVGKSAYFGCVSPVYYVIYSKDKNVNMDFYGYLLNIPIIRDVYHKLGQGIYAIERGDGRVNTCRLKVDYYEFSQIKVPVPPIEEQNAIVSFLKEKEYEIDELIKVKQEKIETLRQYRQSLIFEAVTGKTTIA